jgi:GH25 family lysozyme M1 (1,4-beta-N-acetylmuramidase)
MGMPLFDKIWAETIARRTPDDRAAANDVTGALGIDCASYQGQPHFPSVAAAGKAFCYVKASEGNGTSYPTLDGQWAGANAAGLVTGLYHFCLPSLTPEANADALAAQVNRLGAVVGHLPPALDLENSSVPFEPMGDMAGWMKACVARLRAQTGCTRVMVYSDVSDFTNSIGESWMDPNIALWIGNFDRPPGKPEYLTPRVAIHQYSQIGSVPGISGAVDLDYAIWPLSRLLGQEDDLTPDQDAKLTDIHNMLPVIQWLYGQFAGLGPDGAPAPFPAVPGWPTLPGGTGQHLSLLDYLREANVQGVALQSSLAALPQQPSSGGGSGGGPLSDDDVARIAAAVVALASSKLAAA